MGKVLLRKVLSRNVDTLTLFYCQKQVTGYVLLNMVQKAFGVRLSSATFYNSLSRLERDNLLDHAVIDGKNGRKAHSYVVTVEGQACLVESVRELRVLLQTLSNGVK